MVAVKEFSWEEVSAPDFENSARRAWREAVAEIAEKAKATLPECNGRVDKAVAIVLNGDVELLPDGTAQVASQSNGQTVYHIVSGECACKDYPQAPSGWRKHKISAGMQKRAAALARAKLEAGTTGQATTPSQPAQLQHFYNEKMQQGSAAGAVRYCHTLLHGALAQAEKHGLLVRNVTKLTELPREVRKEMHTLTLDQVTANLLPAITQDRLFAALFLAFGTGLRRGELLALRWKDVDQKAGTLEVRQTLVRVKNRARGAGEARTRLLIQEPKTQHSHRTVPIPEACLAALKQHRAKQAEERLLLGPAYQDHGLVFCRPDGTPMDPEGLPRTFARLLREAGLPPLRFHDARHTFATLMLELGESPKTVQTMLGHSRVAITLDIYSHVSLELEKKAAAKLNAALTGRASAGLQ